MCSRFASNRETAFGGGVLSLMCSQGQALLRPLPQSYRLPGGETIDRDFGPADTNLDRVALTPARVVDPVAVGEEVDPLIGRADPASRCVGQLAEIRAVDQDVRVREQTIYIRVHHGPRL